MVTSRKEIQALQNEVLEIHAKFRRVRKSLKKNPDNTELRKKKDLYRERMQSLESQVREAIEERRNATEEVERKKTQKTSEPPHRHPHTKEERAAQRAARKRVPKPDTPPENPSTSPAIRSDLDEVQLPESDPDDSTWVLSDSQLQNPTRFEVGESKFRKRIIVPPTGWFTVTFLRIIAMIRLHPVRILMLLLLIVVLPAGGVMKYKLRFHEITSKNTEPTLNVGDKVLVWVQRSYRPGDLVVISDPYVPNRILTRRVVAVAGDEIELRNRRLYVNNEELVEPYVTKRANFDFQFGPMEIATGQVYAISDNRSMAPDDTLSYLGVSTDSIHGKILFRYFPRSALGLLE